MQETRALGPSTGAGVGELVLGASGFSADAFGLAGEWTPITAEALTNYPTVVSSSSEFCDPGTVDNQDRKTVLAGPSGGRKFGQSTTALPEGDRY